jgi:hypothetical protein
MMLKINRILVLKIIILKTLLIILQTNKKKKNLVKKKFLANNLIFKDKINNKIHIINKKIILMNCSSKFNF